MEIERPSRREALILGLAAIAAPIGAADRRGDIGRRAAMPGPTRVVQTSNGPVRGMRQGGVAQFLGIPYGANTGARRFLPPVAPQPWRTVRECNALGAQAVQGVVSGARPGTGVDLNSPVAQEVMRRFKATMEPGPGSEDCLFLNVWTSSADPRARRPVMVWLHGGGFAIGSGGDPQYEGSGLVRRGDVVVVTLNHRLNALGYLYLGDLHPDFADSGNSGTLDQILALEWVRDNISEFGGDPHNVTIFGESGGGSKVSAMLAVPRARGLFHKAIIQSGPGLKMADKGIAAQIAERTIAGLGIARADVHKLQTLDVQAVIKVSAEAAAQARDTRALSPVVDGRTLPTDPFDRAAPGVSRNVPLMIGSTKDEATLFTSADPHFGTMTEEEVRGRFATVLKERGEAAFAAYKAHYPGDKPTYWFTSMMTDMGTWMNSIRLAERKAAQGGAPVWMFRFDWHLPIMDGIMRAPHGTDVPLVFDTTENAPLIMGADGSAKRLAATVSQAWIDFARSGNPSQQGLVWPAYDRDKRQTMIFDTQNQVVADPDGDLRRFWAGA